VTEPKSPAATNARHRRRWPAQLLTAAATVLLVAACSSTGASTAPSGAATGAPSPAASGAASAPAAGTVQDLAVTGKEFAFDMPATIPAGPTRITLTNAGQEEHQAQVAKLADGKTLTDLTAALAENEASALALVTLSGGPTGVQPGTAGSTTTNLAPGNYVFLCFVSGADGIPHLAKGMIAPLQVTEPAVTADVPSGDAAVTLQDFAFVGLDKLSTGPHTVTVKNAGPQPHEATIVKLADGVAAGDLVAMFTSTTAPAGPPPFTTAGGVAGIAVGDTVTMDVDLPAGNYAFVCFVPDAKTGAPHAALGMIAPLTIE
jgi:plastocyanin